MSYGVEPEPVHRRPRERCLVAIGIHAVPAEPAHHQRERQPLADEGREDDREREELDQVALREVGGQGEAAASDTAPRRPLHATRNVSRVASRGIPLGHERRGEFGSRLARNT